MKEIVKKNVLDAIHHILKEQHQYLDEEKMNKADELIIPYVEENCDFDEKEFKVKVFGVPVLSNDRRIFPVVVMYYAIMQDNVELLKRLKEKDYSFGGVQHSINIYALDKQLSSKFKELDYIRYLIKYGKSMEHFYLSLRGLDNHEREKVIRDFSDIVKADPTVLKVGEDEQDSCNYLTRRNIELFGKDYLINLDEKRRKLLNSFHFQINEENVESVRELVDKYPDYNNFLPLYKDVLALFSVDDLGNMTDKDAKLYAAAYKNKVIYRMKELLSSKPDFDCPIDFIRYEIFKVLSNEEILELDYDVMDEISKIKYVELDNVYVLPVKKINSIIHKDKFKKRKDEIIERIDIFHRK